MGEKDANESLCIFTFTPQARKKRTVVRYTVPKYHAHTRKHPTRAQNMVADAPPPLIAVCFCGLARAFILSEQRANLRANLIDVIRSAGFRVHAYLQTSLADHPRCG